jgi:hypothetical protein
VSAEPGRVADFPIVWAALLPRERRKVVEMIVWMVLVDPEHGFPTLTLTSQRSCITQR